MPDTPFRQPISHKFALPDNLKGKVQKLCIDQDGIVYILTSEGVARLIGDRVVLDQSYRPLAGRRASDLTVESGKLYYLFPEEVLCNRDAGKYVRKLDASFEKVAVNEGGTVLLARGTTLRWPDLDRERTLPAPVDQLVSGGQVFFARCGDSVFRIDEEARRIASTPGLTVIEPDGEGGLFLGTTNGYLTVNAETGEELAPRQTRLPAILLTVLVHTPDFLWAATTRGIWRRSEDGSFRYFASKRWLDDDAVVDLAVDPEGNVFALTQTGLNEIEFRWMTLEEKAMFYETKIRQRHIRYGFCAELHLKTPGDITTAEMIDTDNDGTWSNYYMASQAFRYGATGDPQARRNAWETFEALERLETINPIPGFPSRTFERSGFKVSDPDRWHPVGDGIWDWKAHTSSDEIAAHAFGSAVLYETAANAEEKERIARFISKIVDHIIEHQWYLYDVDGKPTLWARWNPEYVNWFPPTIFDRRLNSAEIIALLQFAHRITGRELYREKADELMLKHGYLKNIMSPMALVSETLGFKHQGIEMGNEWNHSDDLLGFVTYWVLYRFAFTDQLRRQYAATVRDHWEIEKSERCPLWSFVYASTGAKDFDAEGALWTLRGFPLDMIDWSVNNSQRRDITRIPPNFRHQQLEELLPPDERRITRWNSQPFILNGGNGGRTELAGDEFLLPYWMGRYLHVIESPEGWRKPAAVRPGSDEEHQKTKSP